MCAGSSSGGATPLPIPNRVVKPASAYGTAPETGWESRSLPAPFLSPLTAAPCMAVFLFVLAFFFPEGNDFSIIFFQPRLVGRFLFILLLFGDALYAGVGPVNEIDEVQQ
jgi:hypothetical protein